MVVVAEEAAVVVAVLASQPLELEPADHDGRRDVLEPQTNIVISRQWRARVIF